MVMKKKNFSLVIFLILFFLLTGAVFYFYNPAAPIVSADSCEDECYPEGQLQCVDNIHNQVCAADFDSDSCLEWGPLNSCQGSVVCGYERCLENETPRWLCNVSDGTCQYVCEDDPSCRFQSQDECSFGESRCVDNKSMQVCGNYDDDPYLEWSEVQTCETDVSCGYGICLDNQIPRWSCQNGECLYICVEDISCGLVLDCENECPERWLTECLDSENYRVCGIHFDGDSCLEWGPSKPCYQISDKCGYGDCADNQKPINWRCENSGCQYDCQDDNFCQKEEDGSNRGNGEYVKNYKKECYDNDVYWFDSEGVRQEKEKECDDGDELTKDVCKDAECLNVSPEIGSDQYCEFFEHCGDGICNCGEDAYICFEDCQISDVGISVLAKTKNQEEFKEEISAQPKEIIDVSLILKNEGVEDFDNVIVSVKLDDNIKYLGNLTLNGDLPEGDIRDGLNIISEWGSENKIGFEAEISADAQPESSLNIIGSAVIQGMTFSDSLIVNVNPPKKGVIKWIISRWWLWLLLWIGFVFFLYWILKRSSEY